MLIKRYPLLRNLILLQASIIIIAVGTFSLIYYFSIQARIDSSVQREKQDLTPLLSAREDQWRAWSQLHLDDTLKQDLEQFVSEHSLKSLQVIPKEKLPQHIPATAIVLPKFDKGEPADQLVYAEIDADSIAQNHRPDSLVYSLLVAISMLFIGMLAFSGQYLYRNFYVPLLHMLETINSPASPATKRVSTSAQGEMQEFINFVDTALTLNAELQAKQATHLLAAQVSHDIRSPLSALNMVTASLKDLPEQKRLIIRNATQRINDIANSLLCKTRDYDEHVSSRLSVQSSKQEDEPVMLVALLDTLISEKRVQYRERMEIEILGDLSRGYGLFANIDPTEFARVMSNLINNSVEALNAQGRIVVEIKAIENMIEVSVEDNGKGISAHILDQLGSRGVSHGKLDGESGTGLGLFHARRVMSASGGSLKIASEVGVGTRVTLSLPKANTPSWFVEKIVLQPNSVVVSVDDDQTIHQIWAGRLLSAGAAASSITHLTFTSLDQFEAWAKTNDSVATRYLFDYEFLAQAGNGLDVIQRTGIAERAILVTSRYEELQVRSRADSMGVKILPKGLAPCVPLLIDEARQKYDAILIDDDTLQHLSWQLAAKEAGRKMICFASSDDFFRDSSKLDPASPLYIDVNLGNGVRGDVVAAEASVKGFREIYLATGYSNELVNVPSCVRAVIGKDPVFRAIY